MWRTTIRPLLGRLARPALRTAFKVRNRARIAREPSPLPSQAPKTRPERVLMLGWFNPDGLLTLTDMAHQIGGWSRFRWDLMNLWGHETGGGLRLPRGLQLSDYPAVFVHPTAAYNSDNFRGFQADLAGYSGFKAVMKQDEQFRTNHFVRFLGDAKFDLLVTCLPPAEEARIYPAASLPGLQRMQALTGYVTDEMRALKYAPSRERPIDIGYRGSPQAYNFGWLPWEKRQIAEVFEKVCAERGLVADIKFGWGDRFFGRAWFDFLGRSKGTLGSESGGSVFDWEGDVEREVQAYLRRHPGAPFLEVWKKLLEPLEGKVDYAQIAPRHFEAAACRTVQILYEGRYSGIFQAGRHYLSLKRDLSNLDEVMSRFADPVERQRIADAAFEEIILDDRHHYRSFVGRLDDAIEAGLRSKGAP